MPKKTIEKEINEFFELHGFEDLYAFLNDFLPLYELYDVDESDDWVKKEVGEENERNVRLVRTVYLLSRFADNHAGKLCHIKGRFKNLWKRLEAVNE